MPSRLEQLQVWLHKELHSPDFSLEPASGDASFRRYFRMRHEGKSFIVMDAPPSQENCGPFIDIAQSLLGIGLNVPEVLRANTDLGFLLLTDLGERLYLQELDSANVDHLYGDAMEALIVLQTCGAGDYLLPDYDQALLQAEMELFREWFLGKHLECTLTDIQEQVLDESFSLLATSALSQPRVAVHRDYHSRNLLQTEKNNPGILDFQDAVTGPITYDLVSLLRDCYISWPRERVENWVMGFHELALQSGILRSRDEEQFLRWFDLMGVQRHLKAIGIFARLNYRDQKSGYMKDIPRTMKYVQDVCERYPELSSFLHLLEELVIPSIKAITEA